MRRFVAGLALAGLLIACGQAEVANQGAPAEESQAYGGVAEMDMAQGRAATDAEAPAAAPPPPPTPADPSQPPGPQPPEPQGGGTTSPILYLAYAYAIGIELPSERLSSVMDRHLQACQAAGPRLCQLIGSNRSGDPDSEMQGYVSLRGEPRWLNTFMDGISTQVDEAGGRVDSQTVNSEDLTRQIVDTEARMRALTSLRDRLQQLLRSRPGRLSDLLEVERELARVQGELDATQSNLAVMRTRVAMSELSLQYHSSPRPVGSDTFEPLRDAFANFLGIIVGGFAAIIVIIAGIIPFAVVIVPLIWLALRWRRRHGGRFFRREQKAPETTPPSA